MPSPFIASALASDDSLDSWYERMEAAERADGWSYWCAERGLYVAPTRELIDALRGVLETLPEPRIEIAAGSGVLSRQLPIDAATDPMPGAPEVLAMDAREALSRFLPRTVFACFPPVDAGIEQAVRGAVSVEHYVYLGPQAPVGARPLPEVERVLLSRLDSLVTYERHSHKRGARAVIWSR